MLVEGTAVLAAVVIGFGATVLMDGWNLLLKHVAGIPSLNYCMLGRWVLHLPTTRRHASIAAAPKRTGECAAGWMTHYSIGVALAVGFVLLASADWLAAPTFLPAVCYGLATVAFPLFVLQPALGLGMASSKAAKPAQARLKSVGTHLIYGLGLYLCAVLLSSFVR